MANVVCCNLYNTFSMYKITKTHKGLPHRGVKTMERAIFFPPPDTVIFKIYI